VTSDMWCLRKILTYLQEMRKRDKVSYNEHDWQFSRCRMPTARSCHWMDHWVEPYLSTSSQHFLGAKPQHSTDHRFQKCTKTPTNSPVILQHFCHKNELMIHMYIHCVLKNVDRQLTAVTSSNLNRFSHFFHC